MGTEPQHSFDKDLQALDRNRIIQDARRVDVEKWQVPHDVHLLRYPEAFREKVLELFHDRTCKGYVMPAEKTVGKMQFRPGEVTLWVGYKESYKSTFINELVTSWACQGIYVALASLEMPAPQLLEKTIKQALARDDPTDDQIIAVLERLTESMTIYDITGRLPPKHLAAVMYFCGKAMECKHFLLDNLTLVLSVDNDRAAEHQTFVSDVITVAKVTGMHIHLVAHCTKPEHGDESHIPTGYNVRGTGAAADMVDNILIVWRNKPKEMKLDQGSMNDDIRRQPDLMVVVDKQRHWDFRGSLNYWIDRRSMRFREYGTGDCKPFI